MRGRGRYVRGEMMHKWNKDERIGSLSGRQRHSEREKISAGNQIFTIFKLRPVSIADIIVASSKTTGNIFGRQRKILEYVRRTIYE